MNILHGLTGSVATTLTHKFTSGYTDNHVKFVLTNSANNFSPDYYTGVKYYSQSENPAWLKFNYFEDKHEWDIYQKDQKVLHIELRKWADVFVIAPCSANTLAKLANGLCDNLLTCVARAWDFDKPFIVAPSMNTKMWEHPITKEHIQKLQSWGIKIIDPIGKKLFCGDIGMGAMADISTIVDEVTSISKD